jgi:NADP-dependent 3-hydroxy acid dehydrogenase YdfG
VLGARRKDRLNAAVKEISAAGGKAISVAVDVTKRTEVDTLIKAAVDSFGRVDVMVNDAGIMAIAPIEALKSGGMGRNCLLRHEVRRARID